MELRRRLCGRHCVQKCGKPPEAKTSDNRAFHDTGGPGEEKGRVKAVENSCGLGWGFRKREEKCGRREEKGRVNAVEEPGGRDGSDVENPDANPTLLMNGFQTF